MYNIKKTKYAILIKLYLISGTTVRMKIIKYIKEYKNIIAEKNTA